jgi:glutamyl-Q tRNA(Asp) synthetase
MTRATAPDTPIFRFAPSPNGHLHLGHAYSALLNFDMTRAAGGRFLLRIEDIDTTRCRPEFEAAIYEDLEWLGIAWERPVRRQSEYLDRYAENLVKLSEQGLTYRSYESRAEIAQVIAARESRGEAWPRDPDGAPVYPGRGTVLTATEETRRADAEEPFAIRLDMAAAIRRAGSLSWRESGEGPGEETGIVTAAPQAWGDVILARKETPTSYHLSVVIDDAVQGITHIVRGQDLFWSTSVHRLLQHLLDLPQPRYHHHRLIRDDEGRKLAKSNQSTALRLLRAQGRTPNDIRDFLRLPTSSGPL